MKPEKAVAMADLDDFFAKKDRKKSKSTKKFSTTDEVAKKLEDNAKKSEKLKKERVPEGDETSAPVHVRIRRISETCGKCLVRSGV